jgi:DedD protein
MDFLLKQRLVGAVVLVALGVIFIPMLLEDSQTVVPEMEPFPEADLGAQSLDPLQSFPPPDAIPREPQQAVVVDEPVTPPEEDDRRAKPDESAIEQSSAAVVPPIASKPAPAAKPGPLDGWVVQVGSFSSEDNAIGLRSRLRSAGFATQMEKVRIEGKVLYRVRVGPFLERREAEATRLKLDKKMQIKGHVLSD